MLFANLVSFSQNLKYAHKVIDTLASPYMHGRGYTFNGHQMAADYISKQLKQIKLRKFNHSYFQTFELQSNVFPNSMEVTMDNVKLNPGADYIVGGATNSCSGTFEIITLTLRDLQNRKKYMSMTGGPTYKNKFVYLPDSLSTIEEVKDIYRNIVQNNVVKASGIITTSPKLTFDPSIEQKNFVHIILKDSIVLNKTPKTITVNIDAKEVKCQTNNIIGYIKGKVDTFIVITAHYDHLGTMGKDIFFPGAHDNASGCAMALDLAHQLAKSKKKPHYGIAFMFFSGEELGLLGSYYYTKYPLFPLSKIKFLINLDIEGSGDEGIQIVNSKVFKKEYEIMKHINEQKKYLPQLKERGPAANSDHYFFYKNGVPSFYIYSLGKYKQYHNIYDTRENIPLSGYENIFKLVFDFINEINK